MLNLKDISVELLKSMPSSSSAEEIMYQINLAHQVLQGIQDIEESKTLSTLQVLENIEKWKSK